MKQSLGSDAGRLGQRSFPYHYTHCLREAPGDEREMLNNKDSYYCLQTAPFTAWGQILAPAFTCPKLDFGQVTFFCISFLTAKGVITYLRVRELCVYVCVCKASQVAPVVKNLLANAADIRDAGSIPRLGRSPKGGHGNPLQYSCLENPMDRGACVCQSQT